MAFNIQLYLFLSNAVRCNSSLLDIATLLGIEVIDAMVGECSSVFSLLNMHQYTFIIFIHLTQLYGMVLNN